jgi:hypothetical protein
MRSAEIIQILILSKSMGLKWSDSTTMEYFSENYCKSIRIKNGKK